MAIKHASALNAIATSALIFLALAAPTQAFVLTGRVLDDVTNQPIPNARVSDDSGAATFSDSTGTYGLILSKGVQYEKAEASGMYPAWTTTPWRGQPLVRDFHLFSRSSPTIRGRVIQVPSGTPQPRVRVGIKWTENFVLTDTLGQFVVPLRAPGMCSIYAQQPLVLGDGYAGGDTTVDVPADSHLQVDLRLRYVVTSSGPHNDYSLWAARPLPSRPRIGRTRWNPAWSQFYMDAGYIEKAGGLERALSRVPGVLIR